MGWKATYQLGFEQVSMYALYKAGLITGLWKKVTPQEQKPIKEGKGQKEDFGFASPIPPLDPEDYRIFMTSYPDAAREILLEADEILSGQVRLFGGPPVPLMLVPPGPLRHWTAYETGQAHQDPEADIKFIWEPARFGWAFILARAYSLSGTHAYVKCFWENIELFLDTNPTHLGPNWSSGQEVALRLMAWSFALHVFRSSPETTPNRTARLVHAIEQHANRIPPTLLYARSQNNNHLITEAVGLYTAGSLLPRHPQARRWKSRGWRWLNAAFQKQIASDGSYVQHSANYHRLMLQAALWANWMARLQGEVFPAATAEKLASATRWMLAQIDFTSGQFPNLGSNDGAYILPFAQGGFQDYRPTLQAAARAFLGHPVFNNGAWDEMNWWFTRGLANQKIASEKLADNYPFESLIKIRPPVLHGNSSWASMRAVPFKNRPAHADQLHIDLWWHGFNIAQDAGTFRYTARSPWNNSLAQTNVHNTVSIDEQDQMTRVGKFLWLDWAQARWLRQQDGVLEAEHDGYRRSGILHRRCLEKAEADCWRVLDTLLPIGDETRPHQARLQWLLPDWPWRLEGTTLYMQGPPGTVRLEISLPGKTASIPIEVELIRAGKKWVGTGKEFPTLGWYSPTYNSLQPAISLSILFICAPPFSILSEFTFQAHPAR